MTQKKADYILFKQAFNIIQSGEHLTMDGLLKIIAIKASMNNGLSNQLKEYFPNLTPTLRPVIEDQEIPDPHWLAGFTSGEGCFRIRVTKSSTVKTGFQVQLIFMITQHSRDEQLIRSFVTYFNCGKIYKWQDACDFIVIKYSDLTNKILPFFNNYPIQGVKYKDYLDWCKAVELIKNKDHLTKEGFDLLCKIKEGMNIGRK